MENDTVRLKAEQTFYVRLPEVICYYRMCEIDILYLK